MMLSFRPFPYSPIRIPWEAEITHFAWNDHFCDKLLRGPFASWRHCHRVSPETRATESGAIQTGTLLRDTVEYDLPYAELGDLAHRLIVCNQIKKVFAFRHRRTAQLIPLMRPQRSLFSTEY
jgi:ligand-binding SRPBCC domain-containing protein